jgi:hypothetical protein
MSDSTLNTSSPMLLSSQETLQQVLTTHILTLKEKDVEYARYAMRYYSDIYPEIKQLVKEKLK